LEQVKKILVTVSVAGMVLSLAGCSFFYPNWGQKTPPIGTPSQSSSSSASQSASQSASATASASPTPTAVAKKIATISILQSSVDSSGISVVAEALNFSEDGGSCTLTYTNGVAKKTLVVKAESNASDTQCFPMNLPLTGLPKGPGLITVSYSSDTHIGTSTAIAVTIP
jgi:hypothetical protein